MGGTVIGLEHFNFLQTKMKKKGSKILFAFEKYQLPMLNKLLNTLFN